MEAGVKQYLSIVVLGHADSGKSSLTGHLLLLTNSFPLQKFKKIELELAMFGHSFKKFIRIVDKTRQEEQRGCSMKMYHNHIQTKKRRVNIVTAPGRKDYIKSTINGIVHADVALLVVACTPGQFEAGISADGQTLEHVLLAYTFGIRQIMVCVNKIDHSGVSYNQERFNQVRQTVLKLVVKVGFKPNNIIFVPISALNGDNLSQKSVNTPWYEGPTLLQVIDCLEIPHQYSDKPLRMIVSDVYKISLVGTVVVGRAVTGSLMPSAEVVVASSQGRLTVGSIHQNFAPVDEAKTGRYVGVNLKGILRRDIRKGQVIGLSGQDPPKAAEQFVATIIILKHPNVIKVGYTPVVFLGSAMVACKIVTIKEKIDRKTGKVVEEEPQSLKVGDAANVVMRPLKPLCVQRFADYPPLGRFAMRDLKVTVGVGIVKTVVKVPTI